jgi:hypothetical protein
MGVRLTKWSDFITGVIHELMLQPSDQEDDDSDASLCDDSISFDHEGMLFVRHHSVCVPAFEMVQ